MNKTITLNNIPVRVSGKIKDVLNIYEKYKIPHAVLMRDYLAVINYRDDLQKAVNPWLYLHRGILHEEIEAGMSVSETAFEFGAMQLIDKKPTDVIRATFYKRRNDSGIECGLVLPEYVSLLKENEDGLIINPSPDMIIQFEKAHPNGRHYYVVNDATIAKLYHIEFQNAVFLEMGMQNSTIQVKNALITTRDASTKTITQMFKMCADFNTRKVISVLPNKFIDKRENGAIKVFRDANLNLNEVLLLDSGTTMTMPKKKAVVFMSDETNGYWQLATSSYDRKTHSLALYENTFDINDIDFWNSGSTLIKLTHVVSKPQEQEEKYSKSQLYEFSPEISLNYAAYKDRGKLAGAAWYCELVDPDTGRRAKRITSIIKKGLRVNDESELLGLLLDQVALDERIEPYIQHDIEEYYINSDRRLSLKSLWLCCRNLARTMTGYEDERFGKLFLGNHTKLCNIIIDENCSESLIAALSESLGSEYDEIPVSLYKQFDILLTAAVKLGYIRYNPLTPLMPEIQERATRRQQDVRNVLTKKHFTIYEEKTIFSYLYEISSNKQEYPLCVSDSIWLVGVIRLFSGIALREAGALTWEDFVQIADTGYYHLRVYKFLDKRGKIQSHAAREDWKRYRLVPCSAILSEILLRRREYLYSKGFNEKDLLSLPIIMDSEQYENIKRKNLHVFCKPNKLSYYCRKLMTKADIPERIVLLPDADKELAVDVYQYNGDIFLSNLRMHLNHDCGFTLGEIAYMTGVTPPDTFSRYYCDYSAGLVQYAMAKKLSRWTSRYSNLEQNVNSIIKNKTELVSGPYSNGCAEIDISISIESVSNDSKIQLSIDAPCGYKVELNKY